jgi:hypothetical protein
MCFTLALAYALALASVINYDLSDAPNCGVTYDRHYDDCNSFIIQATGGYQVIWPKVNLSKGILIKFSMEEAEGLFCFLKQLHAVKGNLAGYT